MSFWKFAKNLLDLEDTAARAADKLDDGGGMQPVGSPAYNQSLRDIGAEFGDSGKGLRKITHIIAPPRDNQSLPNTELRAALGPFEGWYQHEFETGSVVFLQSRDPHDASFDTETAAIAAAIKSVGWIYAGIEIELIRVP